MIIETTCTASDSFARNVLGWDKRPVRADTQNLAFVDGIFMIAILPVDGAWGREWTMTDFSEVDVPLMAIHPEDIEDAEVFGV